MTKEEFEEKIQILVKKFRWDIEKLETEYGETTGLIEILKWGKPDGSIGIIKYGVEVYLAKLDEEESS